MKFNLIKGCVCDSMTADDVEMADMTEEQLLKTLDTLYNWYRKHPQNVQSLVMHSIECYYDTYESDDHPCECCGDYVETMTWEI
uniref:Uncharacterized protein n=1 Tax=Podoviridae sp. ctz6O13 TaxID=2827757 RepID=A0A8S5TL36_9CAUD|nr:MAG TPA: hypothetical protein [Podoviridae sp. ctz6O13]